MLASNLEGVETQRPASSGVPSINKQTAKATVRTYWIVVFAPCLYKFGQAKNLKASELEGALVNTEPNTSLYLYKWENQGLERRMDLFMVI